MKVTVLLFFILISAVFCQKLTHAQAMARIKPVGIGIWSSGGCHDRNNPRFINFFSLTVKDVQV